MPPITTIRGRVARLVALSGLAPSALSARAGLAPRTVHNVTHCATDPELPTLRALARVTGASLGWLVLGEGDEPGLVCVAVALEAARVARAARAA